MHRIALIVIVAFLVVTAAVFLLRRNPASTPSKPKEEAQKKVDKGKADAAGTEAAPKEAGPTSTTKQESMWQLVDERSFTARQAASTYLPYYVIQAGGVGSHGPDEVMQWKHYPDEPAITFDPKASYLLDASRVFDRWVRLSTYSPHTVRWVVEFQAIGGAQTVGLEPDGIIFRGDRRGGSLPVSPKRKQVVELTRTGTKLSAQMDGGPVEEIDIPSDDRTPLRLTAQIRSVLLFSSKLYFGKGEELAPPEPPKTGKGKPLWDTVYAQSFGSVQTVKGFVPYPDDAHVKWNRKDRCLEIGPRKAPRRDEAFALFRRSLPGDFRIRFRARSLRKGQPPFFGLLASVAGKIRDEDGYYIEWNSWQVQIKRKNARKAGRQVSYPRPGTNCEWLKFEVQRIGGTLIMFTEGKEVMRWEDPHPYKDAAHDLLAFYTWRVPLQFDDLRIDRNRRDSIKPRKDHPAVPKNYIDGNRDGQKDPVEFLDF